MDFACVSCNADICILDIRRLANFDDELVNEKANMMLGKELMRNKNYGYCKICNQIGRFEAENLMNCMICKKRYCFKCQREPHGSLSCKQFDDNLFEEYKRKYTKPCANCRAPIEKDGGCNKVHCTACKKFMCWICGGGFNQQQETYNHINQAHPGQLFQVPPE